MLTTQEGNEAPEPVLVGDNTEVVLDPLADTPELREIRKQQAREWAAEEPQLTHFRRIPLDTFDREELIGLIAWLSRQNARAFKTISQLSQDYGRVRPRPQESSD